MSLNPSPGFRCFLQKDGHTLRTSFRCIPKHLLDPKERPIICHVSKQIEDEFDAECCWDGDNCNANITLSLPEYYGEQAERSRIRFPKKLKKSMLNKSRVKQE